MYTFKYIPSKTGLAFHESDKFIKIAKGPFASGKTCFIVHDILYYAMAQNPAPDGVRYTKVGVIRSTYPELSSTTRDSLVEVFPSDYGSIRQGGAPITGMYRIPLPDGTIAQIELVLQALEGPDAVDKIRSANWSFAWINEATSVDFEVLSAVAGRVGRYPTKSLGDCSYAGVLIDCNQPPRGHYLNNMIANPADNCDVFIQPPAAFKIEKDNKVEYVLNENAENLENLKGGLDYYKNQIDLLLEQGRTDLIDSLFCMLDVPMKDGKPVFGTFNYSKHVAKDIINPLPYNSILLGYDTSGVHPALVVCQFQKGQWCITDELYGEEVGLAVFVESSLIPLIKDKYPTCSVTISCDPANAKDAYTAITPSVHLKNYGFNIYMPRTNSPKTRIEAVNSLLNKNIGGFLISPHCTHLIEALQTGYKYKKLKILGAQNAVYEETPIKNIFSHIADAIEYAALGILNIDNNNRNNSEASELINKLDKRRKTLRKIM